MVNNGARIKILEYHKVKIILSKHAIIGNNHDNISQL